MECYDKMFTIKDLLDKFDLKLDLHPFALDIQIDDVYDKFILTDDLGYEEEDEEEDEEEIEPYYLFSSEDGNHELSIIPDQPDSAICIEDGINPPDTYYCRCFTATGGEIEVNWHLDI